MKLFKFSVIAAISVVALTFLGGCSEDEGIDNRDQDYGFVQFKLYKEASYEAPQIQSQEALSDGTRAVKPQLDYLAEASKVKVTFYYKEMTIAQTLTLSAADKESAEFGLRSDKLELLTGEYQIVTFTLYDANDELIYNGTPENNKLMVVSGGLTQHDLTVDVTPRGKVRFTLEKDMSGFTQTPTRSVERQYTFDEVAFTTLTVQHKITNEQTKFERLEMKFENHFLENGDDTDGYQTSSSKCDSILSLKAGDYRLLSYETYDKNKTLLERNSRPKTTEFTVEDNKTTEVKPQITLYESDEYIKDYYALYEIWKNLDGENWYYSGENFPAGSNWDFNKDPDMWGNQPGVELHSNGRVAKIVLSDFGFRGHMPKAIGQFTQLIELYLGTHNDSNLIEFDPSLAFDQSLSERSRNRMDNHRKFLKMIHPATQMSEPCALALKEHNIEIPAVALYDQFSENEIIEPGTGRQKIRPYDTVHGKLCNGLLSLPEEIGNLKNLEYFNLANSPIEHLPDGMAGLVSCTDFEIYNCPNMTEFPMSITQMPKLVSVNLSNNSQWNAEQALKGLKALAEGPSKEGIQILYFRDNSLEELPKEFRNMKKIGMLDMTNNKIKKIPAFGKDVGFVQLYLDHNEIEEIPRDEATGLFCAIEDIEDFSITYNKLKKVPNIFTAKTKYVMGSVDFSGNQIDGFEGEEDGTFKGINVQTLTLADNAPMTKFPKCLATTNSLVAYIILRGCSLNEIPEGSFSGKNSSALISLDLTYNKLTKLPKDFTAEDMPFLYGLDLSYNSFNLFPFEPLSCAGLTVYGIRGQRDAKGARCLKEWPTGLYKHTGLRGFYISSNDLRKIDDTISHLIYNLDISDNPNITFDASDICSYYQQGLFYLTYDKSQNIVNCDSMLK